jgi:hypothetical protein
VMERLMARRNMEDIHELAQKAKSNGHKPV